MTPHFDYPRIDAHQQFWEIGRFPYPWLPEGPGVLREDHLPARLQPLLADHRFDGTVLVEAYPSMEEARWLLQLAHENDFVRGVVAWVDLAGPAVGQALDELQKHPRFRGVRYPADEDAGGRWLLRDDVLCGLRELARRDLPFDLLIEPRHLPLVPVLAERVPELRMVIDHLARPEMAAQVMEPWASDIAQCAALPQVWCKIPGLVTEAPSAGWKVDHLRPYVRHVLEVFGPGRLMFGSDWPACRRTAGYKQVLALFTQAIGPQTQEVRARLLGGSAFEFYKLTA